jgi:hypothetical protein
LGLGSRVPHLLFDLLQLASDAGLWLEIALPTCMICAFNERDIMHHRLYTNWDYARYRNNASFTWSQYMTRKHNVYHPIKLTGALMARLQKRDDGWI